MKDLVSLLPLTFGKHLRTTPTSWAEEITGTTLPKAFSLPTRRRDHPAPPSTSALRGSRSLANLSRSPSPSATRLLQNVRETTTSRPALSPSVADDQQLRGFFVGGLLRSSWSVRIEQSRLNEGYLFVGVCDAQGQFAWGLHPCSGLLYRLSRDATSGQISFNVPPPKGYPDGDRAQVLVDRYGRPENLCGKAHGAIITCRLDEEPLTGAGVLAFSVNGGRTIKALHGFPAGAKLRRWALVVDPGDKVIVETS